MTTLSLKIEANTTGIRQVSDLLDKVQSVMLKSSGMIKSFDSLQRSMSGLKTQSMELKGQMATLNTDFAKTQASSQKLADSERKLTEVNKKLTAENLKLASSNKTLQSSVEKLTEKNKHLKAQKDKVSTATVREIGMQKDLHSALRGTAGALGGLWLSYGRLIPMIAAFAEVSGVKKVLESGAEFEFQMKFIQTVSGKTEDSISGINRELLEMSRISVYAPNEMAKGLRILTQSGIDPAIAGLKTLESVLNLAILGEFTMADAATTVQTAMHAFNMEVADIPHAVDSITKASFLAATNVREMSAALSNAAQVGSLYGVSLDETNAMLAIMAKSHLVGARAGTALTNMMRDLAPKSEAAAHSYKELNVEVYDSEGNMKPVIGLFGELSVALSEYDKQSQSAILKTLQNRRGIKAMVAILPYATTALRDMYTQLLLSSTGVSVAEKAVNDLRDTVQSDMKRIASHIQEGMILAFQDSNSEIRGLTDAVREFVGGTGFQQFITNVISGTVKIIKYVKDHKEQIITLTKAYVTLKVSMLALRRITAFAAITTGAASASAAVGALSTSLMSLKAVHPVIGILSLGLAAVVGKTLTTKEGLSGLKDEVGKLNSVLEEMIDIDIVGWISKAKDAVPDLKDVIGFTAFEVSNVKDTLIEQKIAARRKNIELFESLKSSGSILRSSQFNGYFDKEINQQKESIKLLEAQKGAYARVTAEKNKLNEATAEKLRLEASAISKKEGNSALKELLELQDETSKLKAYMDATPEDKERLISEAQAKAERIDEFRRDQEVLKGIKEHYAKIFERIDRLRVKAQIENDKLALSSAEDTSKMLKGLMEAELEAAKEKDQITGDKKFEDPEKVSARLTKRLNLVKAALKDESSLLQEYHTRSQSMLNASRDLELNTEAQYYEELHRLRIEDFNKKESLLLDSKAKLSGIVGEAGKDTKEELAATKELERVKQELEILAIQKESYEINEDMNRGLREKNALISVYKLLQSDELVQHREITRKFDEEIEKVKGLNLELTQELDLIKLIEAEKDKALYGEDKKAAYSGLQAVKIELMTEEEKALDSIEKKYDAYREAVDRANTVGIIGLNEELKLIEKINEAEAEKVAAQTTAIGAMQKGLKDYAKTSGSVYKQISDVTKNAFSSMEDSVVNFVETGKLSFSELADSIISDLIRIQIRQAMLGNVTNGSGGLFGSIASFGASLFTSSGISGTSVPLTTNASTYTGYSPWDVVAHGGMTHSKKEQTVFIDKGERILSPNQNRDFTNYIANGGGKSTIIINNNTNSKVTTEEKITNGSRSIEVIIDEVVAANIGRGGKTSTVLNQMYGLNPQLARR